MKTSTPKSSKKNTVSVPFSPKQLFVGTVVMFVLSVVTLAIAIGVTYGNKPVQPQKPFTLGQPISQGLATVIIDKLRYDDGQKPFVAPNGKTYAILRISIKNNSDQVINVHPSTDTYLKNTAGDVAYLTVNNLANPLRAGALAPGEQLRGEISYLIDKDQTYQLYIDSIWSGSVLPFSLKTKP